MNTGLIVVIGVLTAGMTVSNAALVFLVWSGREERRQLVNLIAARNPAEVRSLEAAQTKRTIVPRTNGRVSPIEFDPDRFDDRRQHFPEPAGIGQH